MWGMNSILFGLLMKVSGNYGKILELGWGIDDGDVGTRLPDGIYLKAEERWGELKEDVPSIYNLRLSKDRWKEDVSPSDICNLRIERAMALKGMRVVLGDHRNCLLIAVDLNNALDGMLAKAEVMTVTQYERIRYKERFGPDPTYSYRMLGADE